MHKFLKTIEKLANAKGIAALLLIIIVLIFIYKNFDFLTEITFKVNKPNIPTPIQQEPYKGEQKIVETKVKDKKIEKSSFVTMAIKNIQLSPVDFKLPTYFYYEILNTGSQNAYIVEMTVDLGEAVMHKFEIRSISNFNVVTADSGNNLVKVIFDSLNVNESIYCYFLLTMPSFKKINLTSPSMFSDVCYTYDNFQEQDTSKGFFSKGFFVFLQVVLCGVILTFSICFVVVVILLLNRAFSKQVVVEGNKKENKSDLG